MERSYLIKGCSRFDGVTYLTVDGKVEKADVGKRIVIGGVSDPSVNVDTKILEVVPPDTIRIAQKGLPGIPAETKGGRVVFYEEPVAAKPPAPPAPKPVPPPAPKPPVPAAKPAPPVAPAAKVAAPAPPAPKK